MVAAIRKYRRLLASLNIALAAAILVCVYFSVQPPSLPTAEVKNAGSGRSAEADSAGGTSLGPLESYAVIYARDLRKPLYDPKPIVITSAPPPKPKLTVALVGTVTEPGFSYAMLKGLSGKVKFVSVGQMIDKAELLEISANSVKVKFHGETITLKPAGQGGTP